MAILYTLTINDPRGVGQFPPDIYGSEWYNRFINLAATRSIGSAYVYAFVFKDQTALDSWLAENTPTDPDVLAQLERWKLIGVEYISNFYTLPEISGTGII